MKNITKKKKQEKKEKEKRRITIPEINNMQRG
jgi:hypothetical protein